MSLRFAFLVLLLAVRAPLTRAANPPASEESSPEAATPDAAADPGSFDRTHERILALFRGRDAIPPLPRDLRNPFSRADERRPATSANPADPDAARQPALSDSALLERVAAAVQIRGIVETGGHPSLIINRKLFEEGDRLTVLYGGTSVEIVIKRITSETFTLGYKEAELTLRLPR